MHIFGKTSEVRAENIPSFLSSTNFTKPLFSKFVKD